MLRRSMRTAGAVRTATAEVHQLEKWKAGHRPTHFTMENVQDLTAPRHSYSQALRLTKTADGMGVPWTMPYAHSLAVMLHKTGVALKKFGDSLVKHRPKEDLLRLGRVMKFEGKKPDIRDNCFIAPSANLIGDVFLGRKSSVGYQATIRGDMKPVKIGESSHIGDKAAILPGTKIGKWCVIDAMAVIEGAQVCSCSMVGPAAIVMKGAKIESNAMLCAASVLQKGAVIPSGEIWAGNPAEKIGSLTDEEKAHIVKAAKAEVLIGIEHHDGWSLTWEEIENQRLLREDYAWWARGQFEYRLRGTYAKDGPKELTKFDRNYSSPAEMCYTGGGSMGFQKADL